jgi:hypothetical protein
MPHFFLNIYDGLGHAQDEEGVDVPSLDEARYRAVEGIRSLLGEEVKAGRLNLDGRIEIADQSGSVLATVPYAECVDVQSATSTASP